MNTELQFLLYDDPSENNNINVVIKDDTISMPSSLWGIE